MSEADIGLIGLAVMGQNLVMNMNDHGFTVAVFNRTTAKVDEFLNSAAGDSANMQGTEIAVEVPQAETLEKLTTFSRANFGFVSRS